MLYVYSIHIRHVNELALFGMFSSGRVRSGQMQCNNRTVNMLYCIYFLLSFLYILRLTSMHLNVLFHRRVPGSISFVI